MNAKDQEDLERFARKVVAEGSKPAPARPARSTEARVVTVTPAEALERTWCAPVKGGQRWRA